MRIDQTTKAEILAKTDIGTYIGTFVALTKRGRDLVGLCPFHGEKTPSFHVHPDRGFFKCFGCGKGGDVITFVELLENVPFPEAARMLARRAGIEIAGETPENARARGERERIFEANELAASYFHRTLVLGPEAEGARAYVAGRGLDRPTIDAFKLGYAPPEWHALEAELLRNGVTAETAVAAGLLRRGEKGTYDFYRARLMIPTYSTTGEIVAFGGRALDDSQPKYLNTSTTPVYTKGRGLYALNVARKSPATHDEQQLIVVEGYLDCIALHQAGFTNAVASLGTAFTSEQATELRKYAERIFLCFDADAAGSNATAKSVDVLIAAGCSPFIVQLPPGEDPDTFTRTHGAAAFRTLLDSALPWIQFKLDREVDDIRRTGLPRARVVERAESLVRALPRTEWDRWRVYVAQQLGLDADDLRVSRFVADPANFAPRAGTGTRYVAPVAEPPPVEREVLAALVDEPGLFSEYGPRFEPEFFEDSRYRRIFDKLRNAAGLVTSGDVYAALGDDGEAVELVVALLRPDRSSARRFQDSDARRAHLDRVLERLDAADAERRLKELDAKVDAAFMGGPPVADAEREEHRRLLEAKERRNRRRLGTR